jgi:hypothetical protein
VHRELGAELGFDQARVTAEAEKFCDHHDAPGNLFADWDAAFCQWLRWAHKMPARRVRGAW